MVIWMTGPFKVGTSPQGINHNTEGPTHREHLSLSHEYSHLETLTCKQSSAVNFVEACSDVHDDGNYDAHADAAGLRLGFGLGAPPA